MTSPTILGFDMGIRNLAYCLIRHSGTDRTILAWDNIDLLAGGESAQTAKQCAACTSPACWINKDGVKWCKGCVAGQPRKRAFTPKPSHPWVPCTLTVKPLRLLAAAAGVADAKKAKKETLLEWASLHYLLPWKPVKAASASLTDIRKAMDTWLTPMLPTFAQATLIRLENQPVMKGPTMKSVQIILFTLLGHRLEAEHGWTGSIDFVHAGTKSKDVVKEVVDLSGATATERTAAEGVAYRNRKKSAETDVAALLSAKPDWLRFFVTKAKKSDLADAFLMATR
jgi:hypothetical protein